MPHIHLPLQSGSDSVLRRMARRCKTAEYRDVVARARDSVPLFNITTDIIVGFPGETEAEWRQTVELVESIEFGDIHVFSYSPRAGTKAASLPGRIEKEIQKMRSHELIALARASKARVLARHVGKSYPVLWENRVQENGSTWNGYTPYYHKVWSRPRNHALATPELVQIGAMEAEALVLRQFDPLELSA
jgi:threonylcarbamoyladenosine tRNA methylthiotransferase MtaB